MIKKDFDKNKRGGICGTLVDRHIKSKSVTNSKNNSNSNNNNDINSKNSCDSDVAVVARDDNMISVVSAILI